MRGSRPKDHLRLGARIALYEHLDGCPLSNQALVLSKANKLEEPNLRAVPQWAKIQFSPSAVFPAGRYSPEIQPL